MCCWHRFKLGACFVFIVGFWILDLANNTVQVWHRAHSTLCSLYAHSKPAWILAAKREKQLDFIHAICPFVCATTSFGARLSCGSVPRALV